jgi:hypothetical protein
MASAKILSLAAGGVSHARIMEACKDLKLDEAKWLLKMLVDRKLLELDSANYWATVDGAKFLEIQFNMERILQTQNSLV